MKQRGRARESMPFGDNIDQLDPEGGVLLYETCWRPRPDDLNFEPPGEKVAIVIYLPTAVEDFCPCGSGKRFGACCQSLPYWRPVCPNPDMQGYSLMHLQSARFTNIPVDVVYAFLQNDERLFCVEDTQQRTFWVYWGDPAFDISQGTLCFGDIELLESSTLLISAVSDSRMEMLLELVYPLKLGAPQIELESFPPVEKPPQKASARKHQQAALEQIRKSFALLKRNDERRER